MPVKKLKEYLDKEKIKYVSIVHSPAYTAQEVAASAHITGKELAKTVIVQLDGETAMAVLPANRKIVLQDLREVTGADLVKFVPEDEFKKRAFLDMVQAGKIDLARLVTHRFEIGQAQEAYELLTAKH